MFKKQLGIMILIFLLSLSFSMSFANTNGFYVVTNGIYEMPTSYGSESNISLVGFDGEGISTSGISSGVRYVFDSNATIPERLDEYSIASSDTPVFVWVQFNENNEKIINITKIYAGMSMIGSAENGGDYRIEAYIGDTDFRVAKDAKAIIARTVLNRASTDDNIQSEGLLTNVVNLYRKEALPFGTLVVLNEKNEIEYAFVTKDPVLLKLYYGLVEEYDEATTNGVGSVHINGEKMDLVKNPSFSVAEGDAVAYISYGESIMLVNSNIRLSPGDVNDSLFRIIDVETSNEEILFTNGDWLDLFEDSDDIEEYKDWPVIEIAVDTKDDDKTLVFRSVEIVGEGLNCISNKKGVRVRFTSSDDEKLIIVLNGVKVNEAIVSGEILDQEPVGGTGIYESTEPLISGNVYADMNLKNNYKSGFYAIVNNIWQEVDSSGVKEYISLVGMDGEGANSSGISNGVDYMLSKNAYVSDDVRNYNMEESDSPQYVWVEFVSDQETIEYIESIQYYIENQEETINDNSIVVLESDNTYKVDKYAKAMITRKICDVTGSFEGYAINVVDIPSKKSIPLGSIVVVDENNLIHYALITKEPITTQIYYGLVEEYDEATMNGVGYVKIDGEMYSLDSTYEHADFNAGDSIGYVKNDYDLFIFNSLAKLSPSNVDDSQFRIISNDTEPDTMVFSNDDVFDLDIDSDDINDYEDWPVVEITLDIEDDNETLKFRSVEKVGTGLTAIRNRRGVRVRIASSFDEKVIIVLTGLSFEEAIVDGKVKNQQPVGGTGVYESNEVTLPTVVGDMELDNKIMRGDLNDDIVINIIDVKLLLQRVIAGGDYIENGDMNGDESINIIDVKLLLQMVIASANTVQNS